MAFRLSPPPNDTNVQAVTWKQWFFKIIDALAQPTDLSDVTGVLAIEHGGTGTTTGASSGKIYEPVAVGGEIVFASNGDVIMAWGGDYAS